MQSIILDSGPNCSSEECMPIFPVQFWNWCRFQHPTHPHPLPLASTHPSKPLTTQHTCSTHQKQVAARVCLPQEVCVFSLEVEATASNSFLVGRRGFVRVRRWFDNDGQVTVDVRIPVKVYKVTARPSARAGHLPPAMILTRLDGKIVETFVQLRGGAARGLQLGDSMELIAVLRSGRRGRGVEGLPEAVQVVLQPAGGGEVLVLPAASHQEVGAVHVQEDFRPLRDPGRQRAEEREVVVTAQHVAGRGGRLPGLRGGPGAGGQCVLPAAVGLAVQAEPHPPPQLPPVHGAVVVCVIGGASYQSLKSSFAARGMNVTTQILHPCVEGSTFGSRFCALR